MCFILNALCKYCVEIGDCWHEDVTDTLHIMADRRQRRLEEHRGARDGGYRHLVESVRTVLNAKDSRQWSDDDWESVRATIKNSVRERVEHIDAVRDMFLTMNMTEDQAYTLTYQLMTDVSIDDRVRERMVTLWWQASILKPFTDDRNVLPLVNGVCVVPDRTGKQLEFNNYVRACLPLDSSHSNLVRQLHTLHVDSKNGRIKSTLLNAGGVLDQHTSLAELVNIEQQQRVHEQDTTINSTHSLLANSSRTATKHQHKHVAVNLNNNI